MSNEKLLEQTKSLKALTGLLEGMLVILFFTGGYIFATKGFNIF